MLENDEQTRLLCSLGVPQEDALHFSDVRDLSGQICAIQQFAFTWAVVVGLTGVGYQRRYCFEHEEDAREALEQWDGQDHPGGPWIKCKGVGVDLLNPSFGAAPRARNRA